jgi:integrase
MQEYRIGRLRGELALVFYDADGRRHRHALGTADKGKARQIAPAVFDELTRPGGTSVEALWERYRQEKAGRAILATMTHTWKSLRGRFGTIPAGAITVADCEAHTAERRKAGIKDGTIHTELGHLRTVVKWGETRGLIDRAPYIARPAKPKPSEKHLAREEVRRLFEGAVMPHVRLAAILLYTTAARSAALLGLTWARCDFERDRIDLRDPDMTAPHKGRAVVPMNRTAKAALLEARQGALSDYVIEWGGKRVASVKRGLATAAGRAGLPKVSPHMPRHSAAVHMAEDGVSIEGIAQFLGHDDVATTRKVYARFSPDHLRKAAEALEYDDLAVHANQRALRKGS